MTFHMIYFFSARVIYLIWVGLIGWLIIWIIYLSIICPVPDHKPYGCSTESSGLPKTFLKDKSVNRIFKSCPRTSSSGVSPFAKPQRGHFLLLYFWVNCWCPLKEDGPGVRVISNEVVFGGHFWAPRWLRVVFWRCFLVCWGIPKIEFVR